MSDSESNKENSSSSSIQRLKGTDNYYIWNRLINVKLAGKGLKGISTYAPNPALKPTNFENHVRNEPKPAPLAQGANDADQEKRQKEIAAWEKKFYKALAIILTSIHANIQGEFEQYDDPAQIMVMTKVLYGKEEMITEVDLREQLINFKYDIHTPADEFFAKIQRILNRLAAMGAELNDRSKISTVMSMFKGKEFTTFKDSLMAQIKGDTKYSEVVTHFKTFIRRKQDEMEIDTSYYGHEKEKGKGRGGYRGRGTRGRGNQRGSHGGGSGSSNNRPATDRSEKECYGCHKTGHISSECPNKASTIARLEKRVKEMKEEEEKKKEEKKDETKGGSKRGNEDGGDDEKVKKARKC